MLIDQIAHRLKCNFKLIARDNLIFRVSLTGGCLGVSSGNALTRDAWGSVHGSQGKITDVKSNARP